jgi:DNA repair protein RadA/Sms
LARKPATRYVCSNCGHIAGSYSGRCPQCGEWNTLEEQLTAETAAGSVARGNPLKAESVARSVAADHRRLKSGMAEIDDVFGGGIVAGSVNLIAGQPGIGKSTLLLQLAYAVAAKQPVLYISGEESAHQIGLRAKRLGATRKELQLATSTSAEDIAATIAGPQVLEHAVDVVLQLEGDRYGGFKLLRAVKNRFGSTNEAGIFEMVEEGLKPVQNPSAALLAERQVSDGSVVLATLEGTRPLLVEVQALVNRTAFGYPKRAASGFDLNRLNLLVAMLERRTKLKLNEHDIYINIVGGIRITEPAADLAVCLAIGSAAKGLQLKKNAAVFGEVGLSGEVRHVPYTEKRLAEAKKLGFDGAIGPRPRGKKPAGLHGVADVRGALNTFLEKD